MSEQHSDNVYARDVNDDPVFIGDVESGRRGYFCLGCGREMQAVKSQKIRSYFRHHVEPGSNSGKCTYSDETYRHKLAKEFLQMQKKVKVPAVYKYPPRSQEGIPNLLAEASFIEAHTVGIERTFFENENGEIMLGSSQDAEGKFLLIRPDVTFFGKDGSPILFIELVVTHKLTDNKIIKIKRLGINTIQIAIPKDSPKSISEALNHTNHTKWIYNREQEDARYVPIPVSNSAGVQPIDEVQRKFFEESFKCRAAQIGNFVRTITRCLESEYYREIERGLRSEISRVKSNTSENQDKWTGICQRRREELTRNYSERRTSVESDTRTVKEEESKFRRKSEDLERRYFEKADKLERKREELEKEESAWRESTRDNPEERITREIDEEGTVIDGFREIKTDLEAKIGSFESTKNEIKSGFKKIEKESVRCFERDRGAEMAEIQRMEGNIGSADEKFGIENRKLSERFGKEGTAIEYKLEERNKRVIRDIKEGKTEGHGKFTKQVEDFANAMALLNNLSTKYVDRERTKYALKTIRSGTYKNWNK
jgi:hypothetical protein